MGQFIKIERDYKLGSWKLHVCQKVTKMGSKTGRRIDYNGVGALRGKQQTATWILADRITVPYPRITLGTQWQQGKKWNPKPYQAAHPPGICQNSQISL